MNKQELIEELRLENPWWKGENVPLPAKVVERDIQDELFGKLEDEKISAMIGLRRTGKTTLLRLIIKKLLDEVEPERICYFSFDLAEEVDIRTLIKTFSEEIIKEPYESFEEKVYFFFDEIQKVEDWGDHLKSFQDKDLDMKFVITGSSSMNITKGAGESLVGRIDISMLNPFSFKEYLRYEKTDVPEMDLDSLSYPEDASLYRIKFKEFMEKGGFPEIYEDNSKEYLKQILDLIFFRDIVDIFTVKRTDVLKGIFREISARSGQKLNYSSLSNDLDTQYRTVKDYLQYLEDSFLIEKSLPWESDHIKSLRKNPKMYVSDHSFADLWRAGEGLKAETIAFNHLKKIERPRFNRDPEVDIVLPENGKAFEVKYSSNVDERDAEDLLEMSEGFELFLVTEDLYDELKIDGRVVSAVPLWLLCLCC